MVISMLMLSTREGRREIRATLRATYRDVLLDDTAKRMELCDTQARLSPDGENATSCSQPDSKQIDIRERRRRRSVQPTGLEFVEKVAGARDFSPARSELFSVDVLHVGRVDPRNELERSVPSRDERTGIGNRNCPRPAVDCWDATRYTSPLTSASS